MNDIDILAKKIAEHLQIPTEYIMWDAEECAKYLKVSAKHFKDRISKSDNFPKPFGKEKGKQTWFACEVMEHAKSSRAA